MKTWLVWDVKFPKKQSTIRANNALIAVEYWAEDIHQLINVTVAVQEKYSPESEIFKYEVDVELIPDYYVTEVHA